MADKSAAGWDLVNEYLSDELASGSEDEKRIRRAEQRALRKRKDRQQQKVKSSVKQSQPSATTTSTCLRPLVKFWRFNGIKIVVFLDDGCGKGESLQTAKGHSLFVQTSLGNAGFVANSTKSL